MPLLALAVGVIFVLVGVQQITSDKVACGGVTMSSGDKCVITSAGSSVTNEHGSQKSFQAFWGGVWAAVGGLMAVGAGALLFARGRAARRRSASAAARKALAQQRGWNYVSATLDLTDMPPAVLNNWGTPVACDVVTGVVGGLPVHIFSYAQAGKWRLRDTTAWMVLLPRTMPTVVVRPGRATMSAKEQADYPVVGTGDAEFDRDFAVVAASPDGARAVLTPAITGYVRTMDLPGWGVTGARLVSWAYGVKRSSEEEVQTAERLVALAVRLCAEARVA